MIKIINIPNKYTIYLVYSLPMCKYYQIIFVSSKNRRVKSLVEL